MVKPLGITEVVLRDAHQSLLATRLRIEDMLPICGKLDQVGFWSMESWGGATFDACIRYLGEDPWERLRTIKQAMPNTPQQMLLRAQNLLGYRHYADDLVDKFVERAAVQRRRRVPHLRCLERCPQLRARDQGGHRLRQACPGNDFLYGQPCPHHRYVGRSGQTSGRHGCPFHRHQGHGGTAQALCRGRTGQAPEEVRTCAHPHAVPCHDRLEHGHHHQGGGGGHRQCRHGHLLHEHDLRALARPNPWSRFSRALNATRVWTSCLLEEIAAYFREVRKKYAKFEGTLRGVDSRILVAQVPGGMLTNMESQLQGAGRPGPNGRGACGRFPGFARIWGSFPW